MAVAAIAADAKMMIVVMVAAEAVAVVINDKTKKVTLFELLCFAYLFVIISRTILSVSFMACEPIRVRFRIL